MLQFARLCFFFLLNSVVLMLLLCTLYHLPVNRRRYIWFILSSTIITSSAIAILGPNKTDKTLLLAIIYLVLMRLCLEVSLKHSVIVVAIHCICTVAGELCVFLVLSIIFKFDPHQIQNVFLLSICAHFINYIPELALAVCFRAKRAKTVTVVNNTKETQRYVTFLLILVAITACNYSFFVRNYTSAQEWLPLVISLMSIVIPTIGFLWSSYSRMLKDQENRQLRLYIETINELSFDLRRFQHNYRNLVQALSGFVQCRAWDGLSEYINEIAATSTKLPCTDVVFSLQKVINPAVFGLLLSKVDEAKKHNVAIAIETEGVIGDLPIKNTDLCEVLGVFIDNAIEAVVALGEGMIGVAIIAEQDLVTISIRNPYDRTQPKGKHRGHGLIYVKSILARYPNILWNTDDSNNTFVQDLLIRL